MGKIFVASDLHFGHNREFLWGPRGFRSIEEHDEAIIANWNSVVGCNDDVFVLGDLMLGNNKHGVECVKRLNGIIHLIRGNHDTDTRWYQVYPTIANVCLHGCADIIHYRKYHFYLSHFPTLTGSLEKESLKQCTLNLYGHTHQKDNFFEDRPYMYHVGLDSHHNTPVLLNDIIKEMEEKVEECKSYL